MDPQSRNIHPIFGQILGREDKERLLKQKGGVYWLTGLSGSGKSTLAKHAERILHDAGFLVKLLDGDNIRAGLNGDLGFSVADRKENIRRIAEVAKLFCDTGIITIASFISPTRAIRGMALEIIGAADFHEVHVNCPLEECERRDVKGLYKKARAGEIKDFTGIHQPFEAPERAALEIRTDLLSPEAATNQLVELIRGRQG